MPDGQVLVRVGQGVGPSSSILYYHGSPSCSSRLYGYYMYIVCGAKEVQGVRRVVALRPSGRALGDSARPLVRRARKCCRCVRRVNKCFVFVFTAVLRTCCVY